MTAKEFWEDDPWLAAAYRDADKLRRQRASDDMWLQGVYIHHAVHAVVASALRKKGTAPTRYMVAPIRVTPLSEQEKQEKAERERQKTIDYFNRLALQVSSHKGESRRLC